MITIKDTKLVALLQEKNELVTQGRRISDEIERITNKITACEVKERKITEKVQPKELGEKAEKMKEEINKLIKEFEKVAGAIQQAKLDGIPKDLEKTHRDLMKQREEKERERNKIALKVQKIKDRVVPKIKKIVAPQLAEFEDIETADIKDGAVVVNTFSHLENWKTAFRKK